MKHKISRKNDYKDLLNRGVIGGHSVHTPYDLIDEMIVNLDDIDNKSIAVLFNVEFVISFIDDWGVDPKNITLFGDSSIKKKLAEGFGCKYIDVSDTKTFLDEKIDMKFDVVVGNPPYLKRTWKKFVVNAIKFNPRIIAVINPDPTNNYSDFGKSWRQVCIDNGIVFRKDVTDYFPKVDSGRISAFIMDRDSKPDMSCLNTDDPILDSIMSQIMTFDDNSFAKRGDQCVSGYGNEEKRLITVTNANSSYIVPCIMSCVNSGLIIKYTNERIISAKYKDKLTGKFWIINRFFGTNNTDPVYEVSNIENYNLGYDCIAFKANKNETINGFKSVYGSRLYRFAMHILRNGGFDITQGNLMGLKRLNLSKEWTDQELYAHFNLTQEEIDYIEETVK